MTLMTHLQTQLLCFWKLVLNVCVCVGGKETIHPSEGCDEANVCMGSCNILQFIFLNL